MLEHIREFSMTRCMSSNLQLIALSLTFEWCKDTQSEMNCRHVWILAFATGKFLTEQCELSAHIENFFFVILFCSFSGIWRWFQSSATKRKCKGNLRVFTWKIKHSLWIVYDSRVMFFRSERVKSKFLVRN